MSFYYGSERISFKRTDRVSSTSKILIKVLPDCDIVVKAPGTASNEAVLKAVKKRANWVYKQQQFFRSQTLGITPRKYISGESHFYLGKRYTLKVIHSKIELPAVKLLRGKIEVTTNEKSSERIHALMNEWYRARAKETFAKRLDALLEQTLWVSDPPPIRIHSMKTQWGSCSPNSRLTLNPNLVKAPRDCIDYVILHELCHIAEHNHSKKFYRLMKQVMPNWELVKKRLDENAALIQN